MTSGSASPWVIVGLPRTGTSLLSILLGLDPVARPLLQWEAAHPIPPATLEEAAEDPRIARTAKDLEGLMKLNPPLRAMHPFGATLAEECVSLFMYDVRTLALETQAHVPTYARWLEQADMAPAYAQHRLALQTLQSRAADRALGAQDAQSPLAPRRHAGRLPRRPGHLDPPRPRAGRHVAGQPGQRRPAPPDQPDATRAPPPTEWRRKCAFALDSAMSFDENAGDGWCQHLHYDALMADPVESVRRAVPQLSARRWGRSTPVACAPSSSSGRRTRSAATATTPPTSAGPTPSWPRNSRTTSSATASGRPSPDSGSCSSDDSAPGSRSCAP